MKPEELLWANVLVRNLLDASGLTYPNYDEADWKLINNANAWIRSSNFIVICEYIGIEPSFLKLYIMKKLKTKKSKVQQTKSTNPSSLKLPDSELLTHIFLMSDEEEGSVVLVKFTNFDDEEQAQLFVDTFKENKKFQQLDSCTIH